MAANLTDEINYMMLICDDLVYQMEIIHELMERKLGKNAYTAVTKIAIDQVKTNCLFLKTRAITYK